MIEILGFFFFIYIALILKVWNFEENVSVFIYLIILSGFRIHVPYGSKVVNLRITSKLPTFLIHKALMAFPPSCWFLVMAMLSLGIWKTCFLEKSKLSSLYYCMFIHGNIGNEREREREVDSCFCSSIKCRCVSFCPALS